MTKSIYKITNLINGKVYIGQSINPKRRFEEHKGGYGSIPLYNSIKKYGVENFSFEIIEADVENYDEREIFWIDFYQSANRDFGYNISKGGNSPPIRLGEDSSLCQYSDQTVEKICLEIKNTNKTFKEIAKEFGATEAYIGMINNGHRPNINFDYPIRERVNEKFSSEQVCKIVRELVYTTKSQLQIARDNNVGEVTIWKINEGIFHDCPENFNYPLRIKGTRYSKLLFQAVIEELKDNKHDFKWIEQTFNISHCNLSRLNQGKILRDESLSYPIRPSNMRVYNPVETIPSEMGSRAAIDKQLRSK